MKKITRKQIEDLATKALLSENPYIKNAIKYKIGNVPMYLYADKIMTKKDIDDAYYETACKDVENGYKERSVGYYDKWYRYSRADGGRAYDLGVRLACETEGCAQEMHIIPCTYMN